MAYSFAIAALIEGRLDATWARWVRPWTLAAWSFLTFGIGLGSWWAYYELGWGGWWYWDPVENASFMPWLAGTALLHSSVVVEKRGTLKGWTVFLAIVTFGLSLLGTFLVRSGVLTSVHTFASDPARGVFILGLLVLVIGGSFALFAWRGPALRGVGLFRPISREGGLLINNLLMTTAAASVLLGTLYPLFLDAFDAGKVSVGPPFFNAVFIPLMVPMLAVMAVGPFLGWKRGDLAGALGRLKAAVAVVVVVGLATWALSGGPVMAILGMTAALWLAAGTLTEFAGRIALFPHDARGQLWSSDPSAALGLGHDAGALGPRRRGRRHHRVGHVADRKHSDARPGRGRGRGRLHFHLPRRPRSERPQLRRHTRRLHGRQGRRDDRDVASRDPALSGRGTADHRSRDPVDVPG